MITKKSPPIISIVGRSGVGKTTFLTKLVAELKHRGYRVAVFKHHRLRNLTADKVQEIARKTAESQEVSFDVPGKDTWRHFQAGADTVIISAKGRMAMYHRPTHELAPDELLQLLPSPVDIVLTEGYTSGGKPTIEIVRAAHNPYPAATETNLIALITDIHAGLKVPEFNLDDVEGVAAFLESRFNLTGACRDTLQPAER